MLAQHTTAVVQSSGSPTRHVSAHWRGLRDELLEGPGDLPVANNYRNVLAPILERHGADAASLRQTFPDFKIEPLPIYA